MQKRKTILCLALLAAGLSEGIPPAAAQSTRRAPQELGQKTITDAAGRKHNVMLMRSTTPAQRKAAADRARAMQQKIGSERQKALRAQGVTK